MNKVTFQGERGSYDVLVNGQVVAFISSGGGEAYLTSGHAGRTPWSERKFMARFKYASALACTKDFAKFCLSRLSVEEILAKRDDDTLQAWLDQAGYVHYNLRKGMKKAGVNTVEELIALRFPESAT